MNTIPDNATDPAAIAFEWCRDFRAAGEVEMGRFWSRIAREIETGRAIDAPMLKKAISAAEENLRSSQQEIRTEARILLETLRGIPEKKAEGGGDERAGAKGAEWSALEKLAAARARKGSN